MKKILIIFVIFLLKSHFSNAQFFIDLESGIAFSGYNDVRITGNAGTKFSLSEELKTSAIPFFRARIQYDITPKHSILALFAPFSLKKYRKCWSQFGFSRKNL